MVQPLGLQLQQPRRHQHRVSAHLLPNSDATPHLDQHAQASHITPHETHNLGYIHSTTSKCRSASCVQVFIASATAALPSTPSPLTDVHNTHTHPPKSQNTCTRVDTNTAQHPHAHSSHQHSVSTPASHVTPDARTMHTSQV